MKRSRDVDDDQRSLAKLTMLGSALARSEQMIHMPRRRREVYTFERARLDRTKHDGAGGKRVAYLD